MSLPLRTRVLVEGSSAPGSAGSGICLTQTTTFMACILRPWRRVRPNRRAATVSRTVRVLLLVNSSASSVTARGRVVIQKALSADHDVTLAETSRRGHATRLAQGAAADGRRRGGRARRRRHAQRGRQRPGRDRHRPGRAAGRLDQRVRPHASGLPDDPIEATGVLLEALARRLGAPGRAGRRQRPLLPLPRRHGLRRRHRRPGRAPSGAQALRQPPAVPVLGVRDLVPPLRPQPTAVLGPLPSARPRRDVVDDVYFAICLNTNPYTYLGTRPLNLVARDQPRHGPGHDLGALAQLTTIVGPRPVRPGQRRPSARQPVGRLPHRPGRAVASRATGPSRTRSTASTSAR